MLVSQGAGKNCGSPRDERLDLRRLLAGQGSVGCIHQHLAAVIVICLLHEEHLVLEVDPTQALQKPCSRVGHVVRLGHKLALPCMHTTSRGLSESRAINAQATCLLLNRATRQETAE